MTDVPVTLFKQTVTLKFRCIAFCSCCCRCSTAALTCLLAGGALLIHFEHDVHTCHFHGIMFAFCQCHRCCRNAEGGEGGAEPACTLSFHCAAVRSERVALIVAVFLHSRSCMHHACVCVWSIRFVSGCLAQCHFLYTPQEVLGHSPCSSSENASFRKCLVLSFLWQHCDQGAPVIGCAISVF